MKRLRSTTCLHHGGSVLVIVLWTCFGLAALAAWGFQVWQERRAHEEFGPGRVVVEPHGRR